MKVMQLHDETASPCRGARRLVLNAAAETCAQLPAGRNCQRHLPGGRWHARCLIAQFVARDDETIWE